MSRARIPKTFDFPFGYSIQIVRLPIEGRWGEWDDATKVMELDSGQTLPQLRYTFLHEMEHAFKDWAQWVRATYGVENPDGPGEETDETPAE